MEDNVFSCGNILDISLTLTVEGDKSLSQIMA